MTDAEATIKFEIFNALVDNTPITNNSFEKVRDDVFNKIFDSCTVWAIEDYLKEKSYIVVNEVDN